MKVSAVIEMWDDKTISVYVPEFDGFSLSGQGKSVDEAKCALHECVEDYVTMFKEQGKDVPKSLVDINFEYKYDIASFFENFKLLLLKVKRTRSKVLYIKLVKNWQP